MDKNIFLKGISELNGEVSEEMIEKFDVYSNLLVEWNEKINLTSIVDSVGISTKHFLDSILPLFCFDLKNKAKIIDIGTGAGFPGIPIKIMREDIEITLMDSLNKRINFLKEVCEKAELKGVEFLHARAEEFGKSDKYREKYDVAVSRAVAPLKILSEYCLPYVKLGGIFISLKSYEISNEVDEARAIIGNLGGKISKIEEIALPCTDIKRKIVFIEKIKETPKQFPRKSNKIK